MRKRVKIAGGVVGALVVAVGGWVAYVNLTYQRDFSATPRPAITASKDPKVIADGEYVVNAIAHCTVCHGNGEYTNKHELPPDLKDLRGGYVIKAGPFGTFYPANLTADPTGIANVSDGDLARAIRHGVAPGGRLDPLMVLAVGTMSDEDLTATISYLRSLPPIANAVPADQWGFIAKAIAPKMNPRTETARKYVPRGAASKERGEYLANGPAACYQCHSPRDPMNGFALIGELFTGGAEADPDRTDRAYELMPPNLTPDPETGVIMNFTEEQFVDRVKKVGEVNHGTLMPWVAYQRMTDEDLQSIHRYLRSLRPVRRVTGPSRRPRGWKP